MTGSLINHILNVGPNKAMGLLKFSEIEEAGYSPDKVIRALKQTDGFVVIVTKVGDTDFNGVVADSPNVFVGYLPALQIIARKYAPIILASGWAGDNFITDHALALFKAIVYKSALEDEGGNKKLLAIVKEAYQHNKKNWGIAQIDELLIRTIQQYGGLEI